SERTWNPGWYQRDQAGMRRDDPEGQQKGRLGEQGTDQPVAPSDQNAQPDDQDDAEVNQVHWATPLSPMAPRNSTGRLGWPRSKGRDGGDPHLAPGCIAGHEGHQSLALFGHRASLGLGQPA